jgi:hypothetical protein
MTNVVGERPNQREAAPSGQVLKFRLPGGVFRRPALKTVRPAHVGEPIDDLAQYEQEDINVNYPRRMLMNVIAAGIVVILIGLGVWIADTISDMQKAQDCVLQGRQNCAPIETTHSH